MEDVSLGMLCNNHTDVFIHGTIQVSFQHSPHAARLCCCQHGVMHVHRGLQPDALL